MVIPLKDPKQRDIVVGVVSVLRGHDGGPVERFGEAELAEAPVNIGLLVQLITWASTATRHKRSHEQRTRLMDVIMLIADTQEVSKARRASGIYSMPSQGSVDTASEGKGKGMRLDELLELARVSLAAQVAVLHTMDTMDTRFLKMHTVKRGGLQHSDELLSAPLVGDFFRQRVGTLPSFVPGDVFVPEPCKDVDSRLCTSCKDVRFCTIPAYKNRRSAIIARARLSAIMLRSSHVPDPTLPH